MDKNILDYWAKMFLDVVCNQQQMSRYMGQSFDSGAAGNPYMPAWWRLKPGESDKEEFAELYEKLLDTYKNFLRAYLNIFDVVSQKEYSDLAAENEELKKKIAEQEKIIETYRDMNGKDNPDQSQIVDNLTQIMNRQTKQFQELMKQVNRYYKNAQIPADEK